MPISHKGTHKPGLLPLVVDGSDSFDVLRRISDLFSESYPILANCSAASLEDLARSISVEYCMSATDVLESCLCWPCVHPKWRDPSRSWMIGIK